jgi:thiol-disulfide isomerase/thioredoxin
VDLRRIAVIVCFLGGACATPNARQDAKPKGPPVASHPEDRCLHGVACETCVKCHPELIAQFKAAGDWCPEHAVPESQCGLCNPQLVLAPPKAPEGADVQKLVDAGQDLPSLEAHVVRGKVTVFDFYADWCGPCRQVDEHVYEVLKRRADVAYRKLNVVSWESPLAKHYMAATPNLPYVVVYGKDGKPAGQMSGLKLDELDRAIAAGTAR